MGQTIAPQVDEDAVVRSWLRRAPIVGRVIDKIGLPGELVACFILLLVIGLAGRCWLFVQFSREIFGRLQHCEGMDDALHRAEIAIVTGNVLAVLLAVPVITILVHRFFQPIRGLVTAANRIAAGDLNARVAIRRPDAIGMLARSFNQMARRVHQQQEDLEKANHRLAEANHDLEAKICHRTAQLEAANNRLNLEIAEKEDFLRAISHDLIAPLRNISGMAAMLLHKKRDSFDEEVIHRLERIQRNVEVESDLIAELLELSKIKSTRQRMIEVDLNDLVRDVADTFEGDLQSRGIRLSIDPLPTLRCERPRLRQVFQNLIDNAIKYMGDGLAPSPLYSGEREPEVAEREIHIGAVTREDEVEFRVRDTGMGIEEEDQETIFYVFRRGRSAAVRGIAGKGVGLACVKSIIETYNGNICVESTVGRGSTFRFTINGKYVVESKQLVGTF